MNTNILQLINTPKEELRSMKRAIEEAIVLQTMLEDGFTLVKDEGEFVRIFKQNTEIILKNKNDANLFTKGMTVVNI